MTFYDVCREIWSLFRYAVETEDEGRRATRALRRSHDVQCLGSDERKRIEESLESVYSDLRMLRHKSFRGRCVPEKRFRFLAALEEIEKRLWRR